MYAFCIKITIGVIISFKSELQLINSQQNNFLTVTTNLPNTTLHFYFETVFDARLCRL